MKWTIPKMLARQAILWATLAVLALPAVVQSQFICRTNNGLITIMGYTGSGGDITIPSTTNGLPVSSIGTAAFACSTSLTSVTIPSSVTSIEDSAFSDCSSLTNVTIPGSVTSIGSRAFYACYSLIGVTIPNRVASIYDNAFWGCTSLMSMTIPSSVTNIGRNAFLDCTSLKGIVVNADNPAYCSVGGVLFDKSQTMLIQYPMAKAGSSCVFRPNRPLIPIHIGQSFR